MAKEQTRRLKYRGPEPKGSAQLLNFENLEAGIVLTGTEVRACATAIPVLKDPAADQGVNFYGVNAHIPEYRRAPTINMKCAGLEAFLHKREMDRLSNAVLREGMTIVPLSFISTNVASQKGARLMKGKRQHEKRASIKA